MSKQIDLDRSVYDLAKEYPELVDIMDGLGFSEIRKPAMLNSVGKLMTITKGAKMKGIPLDKIVTVFWEHGFTVAGYEPLKAESSVVKFSAPMASDKRTELLKSYLRRLRDGEALESVRADFVERFADVEASEIMKAEQELMAEGTPLSEVQKLCDIHSALFHGATREERIQNAEKEVAASVERAKAAAIQPPRVNYSAPEFADRFERAAALAATPGHPLNTLTRENDNLTAHITELREALASGKDVTVLLAMVRGLSVHYAKKGDLLYPQLAVKYAITGPSEVMWTVDDEIRDELAALDKETERGEEWTNRLLAVLKRAEEMIYKEKRILFPICTVNFSQEEWQGIYRDSKDYDDCLGVTGECWEPGEQSEGLPTADVEGEIVMPGGHMTLPQLTAMLNTIPLELTFVDAENINRYFNEGPKVFKRPGMAIDREVFSCHPPKIEPMVRAIIEDFRAGRRDRVPIWMEKNGKPFLVTYMAVRDRSGAYLGTLEVVQDMEFAREHFTSPDITA